MRFLAVVIAWLASLVGCNGGGGSATDVPGAGVGGCDDCRTVASGNAFQDGETAVGVGRCDPTSCRVVVADPDGSETDLDVAAGDRLDADRTWLVVATGTDGLTVRPAP